jgi:hypothetical protein
MIMNDHTLTASLHVISHFNVAQAVPVAGSISFAELSDQVGLSELDVARFVRRTAINRIFVEAQPGYVAHTATSALLATDPQMQALVAHMSEEAFPASARIVDALEISKRNNDKTGGSEANESPSPFALAFGSSFFARKAAQPETLQRFGLAMSSWSSGDGAHQMVTCYDWGALPTGAKVVDVGGALGHISLAIADAFPGLEFVVEDQAPLAQQANELIASHSESVSDRVRFLPWDFFNPQPEQAQGANVYILRYILHDWADNNATTILGNILSAAGPKSKVLIADAVMPTPGVLSRCQEEVLRSFDVVSSSIPARKLCNLADGVIEYACTAEFPRTDAGDVGGVSWQGWRGEVEDSEGDSAAKGGVDYDFGGGAVGLGILVTGSRPR